MASHRHEDIISTSSDSELAYLKRSKRKNTTRRHDRMSRSDVSRAMKSSKQVSSTFIMELQIVILSPFFFLFFFFYR